MPELDGVEIMRSLPSANARLKSSSPAAWERGFWKRLSVPHPSMDYALLELFPTISKEAMRALIGQGSDLNHLLQKRTVCGTG